MAAVWVEAMTGNYFRMLFRFNWRQFSANSLLYYVNTQVSNDGMWQDAWRAASGAFTAMYRMTGAEVEPYACSIALLGTGPGLLKAQRQADIRSGSVLGVNRTATTNPIERPEAAWQFSLKCTQFGMKRQWPFRLMPAKALMKDLVGGGYQNFLTGEFFDTKNACEAMLCGNPPTGDKPLGEFSGRFGLKGLIKNPVLVPPVAIVDVKARDDGYFQLLIEPGNDNEPEVGERIQVRNALLKCGSGPSGAAKVLAVDQPDVGHTKVRVTIDKKWCCGGEPVLKSTEPELMQQSWGIWRLTDMITVRTMSKKSGPATGSTRGRRRSRCC